MLFRTRGRPAGDALLASPLFCFLEYSIISSRSTHIIGIFTLGDLLDKPWSQASTLLPPSELPVIFIAPMIQYSHRSSDSMLMFTNLRSRTSGVVDKPNEGASLLRGLNFQSRPSGTPIICTMKNARVQKPKKSTKLRFDFPDFFGIYLQGLAKTVFFFCGSALTCANQGDSPSRPLTFTVDVRSGGLPAKSTSILDENVMIFRTGRVWRWQES